MLSEMWISMASAVVAVCALGVTVWQGNQNYRHNKMSVRPKLTASEDYQDDDNGRVVSFELINAGFGPAIIKDFILVYDGKVVAQNNRKTLEDFLKKLTKDKNVELLSLYSFIPDSLLLTEESSEIFSFYIQHGQDMSFIDKLNIRINYQSIYEDETWEYDSKKDRRFQGREVQNV